MKQLCQKAGQPVEQNQQNHKKIDKNKVYQQTEMLVTNFLKQNPASLTTSMHPFFLTKMKGIDYDKVQKYRDILKKKRKSFDFKQRENKRDIRSEHGGFACIESDDVS